MLEVKRAPQIRAVKAAEACKQLKLRSCIVGNDRRYLRLLCRADDVFVLVRINGATQKVGKAVIVISERINEFTEQRNAFLCL